MCKAIQFRSISNTREPYLPQPDHPATCAVQQCFPTTAASLCFHSRKEKFGALFKNVIISAFFGFNTLRTGSFELFKRPFPGI
jgi:hypothetical protein